MGKAKILIADDDPDIIESLQAILESLWLSMNLSLMGSW